MKIDDKTYSLDTNIIIRFLTRDDEALCLKAEDIMRGINEGSITAVCDPVILAEAVWVLSSFYRQSKADISKALAAIVKLDSVLVPNKSRYILALDIFGNTNAHFGDACACAAALECCEGRLFSFDRKLSKIDGISRSERPK